MSELRINPNAAGIKFYAGTHVDFYSGAKERLLAAGVPADWFPAELAKYKSGKTKLTYDVPGGRVTADNRTARHWRVAVYLSDEESERRSRQEAAARQAAEDRQRAETEARFRSRFAEIMKKLPAFVPGSITEGEKHHLRLLRALNEETRDIVLFFVERQLVPANELEATERKKPILRLVVK